MDAVPRESWQEYVSFVDRTAGEVYRRFRGRFDRDDLRQAGLLKLVESLASYDGRSETFDGYVRVRVRGAIFDAARRELRRTPETGGLRFQATLPGQGERAPDELALDTFDPTVRAEPSLEIGETPWQGGRRSMESEVLYREFVRSLRRRLASLEQTERGAIQACDLDQLSLRGAGERLGMSAANVLRLRRKALQRLRGRWADTPTAFRRPRKWASARPPAAPECGAEGGPQDSAR